MAEILYDYNFNEPEDPKQKRDKYYGEFSSRIRRSLLSKNLEKPTSIYDVFYSKIRETMLSKNVSNDFGIDEASKPIRDAELSKNIGKILSLENSSEETRQSMLARNKINVDYTQKNLTIAENIRKELLSKNVIGNGDLLRDSQTYLNNQTAANVPDKGDLLKDSAVYLDGQTAKNTPDNGDLLKDSATFLKNEISKNIVDTGDLLTDSKIYQDNQTAKNVVDNGDLLKDSATYLKNQTASNVPDKGDLLTDSAAFLKNQTAANVPDKGDLLKDSSSFLKNQVAANIPDNGDLLADSKPFLNNQTSANIPDKGDLLKDSSSFLKNQTAANVPDKGDLLTDSAAYLKNQTSANIPDKGDLLVDSKSFLSNQTAANIPDNGDLLTDSQPYIKNQTAANVPDKGDLLTDSATFLKTQTSANIPDKGDLLKDSAAYLNNQTSANVPDNGDLLKDSAAYLKNQTTANVPDKGDLLTDSAAFLKNQTAANVPDKGDLLKDSATFLKNQTAPNVSDKGDLLTDSQTYLNNQKAANVVDNGDLLTDSATYLKAQTAINVPDKGDLLKDSAIFLKTQTAVNAPDNGDLLTDSATYLKAQTAVNTPDTGDLLTDSATFLKTQTAANVPDTGDLLTDSAPFLKSQTSLNTTPDTSTGDLISSSAAFKTRQAGQNTPVTQTSSSGNLLTSSSDYLTGQLSHNHHHNHDSFLLDYSQPFLDNNLARNDNDNNIGTNVFINGISEFINAVGVYEQGLIIAKMQTADNIYTVGSREYMGNQFVSQLLEDTIRVPDMSDIESGAALPMTPFDQINVGMQNSSDPATLSISSPLERNFALTYNSIMNSVDTYARYGLFRNLDDDDEIVLDGMTYDNGEVTFVRAQTLVNPNENNINILIAAYSKYRNPYQLNSRGELNLAPNDKSATELLSQIRNLSNSGDPLFKSLGDLFSYYPEALQPLDPNYNISINVPSGGNYLQGDANQLLDPNYNSDNPSVATQTKAGNVFDDDGFKRGIKGVRQILDRIQGDGRINFAQNFQDIQNQTAGSGTGEDAKPKVYVIGTNKNGAVKAQQKFTIKNPYAPKGAYGLIFSILNYSIDDPGDRIRYFPPYIESFQNNDQANWNAITFLGRPEPIYTYSNSSRDGSISFYVLTDYAQDLIVGRQYEVIGNEGTGKGDMTQITKTIDVNFTDANLSNTVKDLATTALSDLQQQLQLQNQKLQLEQTNSNAKGSNVASGLIPAPADSDTANSLNSQMNALGQSITTNAINSMKNSINSSKGPSEQSGINGENVYNKITNDDPDDSGYINSKPRSMDGVAADKLDEMIAGLQFQPAYFSGSLVDFKNRMEFIARLTRPAKNNNGFVQNANGTYTPNAASSSGFSFTRPPVCHIQLGDWFDHDVIINAVNYDYTNASWTLGQGVTQPMWCKVNINFNIVGPVGGGVPLTSTDKTGYFGSTSTTG